MRERTQRVPGEPAGADATLATSGGAGLAQARQLDGATWATLALIVLALALRLWPLFGGIHDYDEGVYWQSLRALAQGQPLFTSVFSSQPPLFLLALYPFYLLFGQTIVAARLAVAFYSFAGLGAIYVAGRAIGGRWVGIIALGLLATDPLYLAESYTLQAEAPSLAFALAAVALAALVVRAAGPRRLWLAFASGLALALGCGVKLFDVVALAPVALYLLAPVGSALVDGAGTLRWPGGAPFGQAVRRALPDLLVAAVGCVLGAALVFLPFVGVWPALYDQVFRFHLAAGRALNSGFDANIHVLTNVAGELPLEALAAITALVALARRRWAVVPPAVWALASLILLLRQQPLFTHHVALLVPPLALAFATGILAWLEVAEVAPASAAMPAAMPADTHRGRNGSLFTLSSLAGLMLAVVLVWGLVAGAIQARAAAAPPVAGQMAVVQALASVTEPGDLVVADDQYVVGLAGRDVPPALVDTSLVRIASGYLTLDQLEAAVRQPGVKAVLFYSGRFNAVPGFRQWMADHYTAVASFGPGTALYVTLPHAPAPA